VHSAAGLVRESVLFVSIPYLGQTEKPTAQEPSLQIEID
jgi:hypothetical protein